MCALRVPFQVMDLFLKVGMHDIGFFAEIQYADIL